MTAQERKRLLHYLIILAIGLAAGPDIIAAMEMRILLELLGATLFLTVFATGARLALEPSLSLLENALLPGAASQNVLKKCGFEYAAEVVDPEDGLIWRFEKKV